MELEGRVNNQTMLSILRHVSSHVHGINVFSGSSSVTGRSNRNWEILTRNAHT